MIVEMNEPLALPGRAVIVTVTRMPKETSTGRVTALQVAVAPEPAEGEVIEVDPMIVVDALIYALKLNYDVEREHGADDTPGEYAQEIADILRSQIERDNPSHWENFH